MGTLIMIHDEMKTELQARKAGYEFLREFNLAEARSTTSAQKWRSFRQILLFSTIIHPKPYVHVIDESVVERWKKIRASYARINR